MGFDDDDLRLAHEASHQRIICRVAGCQYPPFQSARSLKEHDAKCHSGQVASRKRATVRKPPHPISSSTQKDLKGDQQQPKQPLIMYKPEHMRSLPEQFTAVEKVARENELRTLWTAIESNGPETTQHQDAKRKLFEFSQILTHRLQIAAIQVGGGRPASQGQPQGQDGDNSSASAAADQQPPQPEGDDHLMSQSKSSLPMFQFKFSGRSQEEAVVVKPTYQRPKRDRVFCKECDDHPDGFRGEGELRRHQDRQHKKMIKKWVCVQPPGPDHPKPAQSLLRCKACTQQQKKYRAHYNAAAHLRRAHFRPKPRGGWKSSEVDEANRRGGKAGGDWPPMSELKHWIMEVEEPAIHYSDEEEEEIEETSLGALSGVTGGNFDASTSLRRVGLEYSVSGIFLVYLPQSGLANSYMCSSQGFEQYR